MRRFWLATAATLIVASVMCYGQWPSPKTAMEAHDFVQQRRAEARKRWQQGDLRGIKILNETLPFLDQPLIRDLAAGNRYLAARRVNIYLDLSEAYAIQGKTRE